MFNDLEKVLNETYPIKKESFILQEELAGKYEETLSESITCEDVLRWNMKDKEAFDKLSKARLKVMSMLQFIIDKYAPDEFKQLKNPQTPIYCVELRKITFTIAEKETIELRNNLVNNILTGIMKAAADKLGKDKK